MNKLLGAAFLRLLKNKVFWICMIIMAMVGVFSPIMGYLDMKKTGYPQSLESGFFAYALFIAIMVPAFCSLFVGTEYSDGTIRNKIVIGHNRTAIYLSNFIVCAVSGFLMCFAYLLPALLVGIPLLGFFTIGIKTILGFAGCVFVLSLAYTSICTLVAMTNQNKATASVICLIGVFLLLVAALYISQKLNAPETYEEYTYTTDTGQTITEEEQLNPNCLRGTEREVYEFLNDFLPGNQTVQLSGGTALHLWQMALYSCLITIVTTGFGIFLFRKKDLK